MKLSIKDFFSKCDQIRVTFTEEIFNGKLHYFLQCNGCHKTNGSSRGSLKQKLIPLMELLITPCY